MTLILLTPMLSRQPLVTVLAPAERKRRLRAGHRILHVACGMPGRQRIIVAAGTSAVQDSDVRAHLGIETPRHWSDVAILRTTPTVRFARHRVGSPGGGWPTLSCPPGNLIHHNRAGLSGKRWLICIRICGPPPVFQGRPEKGTPDTFHEPFSTAS